MARTCSTKKIRQREIAGKLFVIKQVSPCPALADPALKPHKIEDQEYLPQKEKRNNRDRFRLKSRLNQGFAEVCYRVPHTSP